ncbi:MAG TPA: FAD binding domain-containing protein [Stellaceae bacterium]|nr:FAD binding domain-containing protein [Stellaceae bacterium]
MLTCDEYRMPETLDDALALMERHKDRYRVIAGATDLLPATRAGRLGDIHAPMIIDLSRIAALRSVAVNAERVRIGACTEMARFLDAPLLARHLPVMLHCAVWFGDDQLREAATIGGNLVNASPAADAAPPLIAMNAVVTLESRDGGTRRRRDLPLEEFVTGPGTTRLAQGELLTAIECDSMAGYGAAFEKVGHRRSLVISTVCVAALVRVDHWPGRFVDIRLAIGAIAPVPSRLRECEEFLSGKPISSATIGAAARLVSARVQSRTRRAYRAEVVVNFIERALTDAAVNAGVAFDDATRMKEVSHV